MGKKKKHLSDVIDSEHLTLLGVFGAVFFLAGPTIATFATLGYMLFRLVT